MPFDLSTAKPASTGFDLSTARPAVNDDAAQARAYIENARKARGDAAFKAGRASVDDTINGAAMGVADIGNTALSAASYLPGKVIPEVAQWNRTRNADFDAITEQNKDSAAFKTARTGSNILMTLPVGGAASAGVKAASPLLVRAGASAPVIEGLANALATSGFRTGMPAAATLGAKAADLGIRTAGGAITGGATAGLINPDHALMGAAIGGALPGTLKAVGAGANLAGRAYRSVTAPQEGELANKLAELIGVPRNELISALTQQGPSMIPGYRATVPQIVQSDPISQLQRTLQTSGVMDLVEAGRTQQGQYKNALARIASPDLSIRDAANRTGSAIQAYAIPARKAAGERVTEAFQSIDPHNQSALHLPIDEMRAAQSRFLGDGTFGTGAKAQQAIDTAQRVGTDTVEATKPLSTKGMQDLVLAVRAAGGINTTSKSGKELGGEIRNLRESGLNNLVRPNTGKSVERMAEQMHEQGFLPDNDPATLLDLLHQSAGGNKVYASGADGAYRHAMEAAQGAPPPAGVFSKTVPFDTIQNLRSSIGEAAKQAELKGATKEAAALKTMVGEIDSRVNRAAGGSVGEGEYFPRDMADRYRAALKLHADKMAKFETGPQVGMFRQGGDGQASIQGAEIPGKFYNGNLSQVEDMKSFKRLIGSNDALTAEMKRYAMTEAGKTANQAGDLTTKFTDWMLSRSGANRALLSPTELATLGEVGKAVKAGSSAENLGRVSGSDTAQKIKAINDLGTLDNKIVNVLATRIPVIGKFTAPMLDGLRATAGKTRDNKLAELLADPDKLAKALNAPGPESNKLIESLNRLAPAVYKATPAATSR